MPITKSAKKALRQDQRRTKINRLVRRQLKKTIIKAKKTKTPTTLSLSYQVLDRAAKKKIIHKNKVARLKSRLAKATLSKTSPKTAKKKKSA